MLRGILIIATCVFPVLAYSVEPSCVLQPKEWTASTLEFGDVVAASGDYIAVGLPATNRVVFYTTDGEYVGPINSPDPSGGAFGSSIAFWDGYVMIGAPEIDSVFVFNYTGTLVATISDKTPNPWVGFNSFGQHLSVIGDDLLVNAPNRRYYPADAAPFAGYLMCIDLAAQRVSWVIENPINAGWFGRSVIPHGDNWTVLSGVGPYPWMKLLIINPEDGRIVRTLQTPEFDFEGSRVEGPLMAITDNAIFMGDRKSVQSISWDGELQSQSTGLNIDDPDIVADGTFVFAADEKSVTVYDPQTLSVWVKVDAPSGAKRFATAIHEFDDCVVVKGADVDYYPSLFVYDRTW